MIRLLATIAFVTLASAIGASPAAADATVDYVIVPGDTCIGIATRELGDRRRYKDLHRLNPGLGALPHRLQVGSVLKLPKVDRASDATLTSARGAVKVRKPAVTEWDAAQRGMDLFRTWRVGARARSSAELTFRDTSQLYMRENTIVIIYGPTVRRASTTTRAELESGALESRLAATSNRRVVVTTPSAEATFSQGNALIAVGATAATIVANHGGTPSEVRGLDARRRPRGTAVRVAVGMGSKVQPGALPSPPRPLPPAPAWIAPPSRFVSIAGRGGTAIARWASVASAARYRIVIHTAAGEDVAALEVPATADAFEIHRLPPAGYTATIATVDAEDFEGIPSAPLAFEVVALAVIAPGATTPLDAPAPVVATSDAGPDPAIASAPLILARGSRILAPPGLRCEARGVQGAASAEIILVDASVTAIDCETSAGSRLPAVTVEVTGIELCANATCGASTTPLVVARDAPTTLRLTLASVAPLGPDVIVQGSPHLEVRSSTRSGDELVVTVQPTSDAGANATIALTTAAGFELATMAVAIEAKPEPAPVPITPPARPALELGIGVFGGYWIVTGTPALGGPADRSEALASGPTGGLRATALWRRAIGVELEAGLEGHTPEASNGRRVISSVRGHLVGGLGRGRFWIQAQVGAGINTLLDPRRPTDPALDLGVAVRADLAHGWSVRLDARTSLTPALGGGIAHIPTLQVGLMRAFWP